ncbi:glycosyltransferase family 2 protein [Halosimplex amylolyticum]|uniref:glycosyltransferase family 2 protein n=1 Tax=Halosimplex amylolyticum TaxID=3396616 RepID=UPI003F5790D9
MSVERDGDEGQLSVSELQTNQQTTGGDGVLLGEDSDIDPTLSVVLPTLNEEDGVRVCIEKIKSAVTELGLTAEVVVSDSSTDRTPEIARDLDAIVVEPEEAGYGNAYKYAFERVRGEYVAIGDADTTYDFEELPKLLETAMENEADMVLGSRLNGEIKSGAMPPLHQYVGNPLLTRFLNTFYDAGVSDAHSGMRVIDAESLAELDLETGGMEFASEMIMDAAEKGMTIEEVPITYHERVGDATLDSFSDGWRHVKFMLTNAPGYLFTLPAFAFGVLGLAICVASVTGLQLGPATFGLQTLVGGVLFAIVGYQVGSLALFSSIAADPIREPQDPITDAIRDHFTLENGATLGVAFFAVGAALLSYSVIAWTIEGYAAVPDLSWNLLAAAAVVIGVQTVFNSFFLSMLAQHTGSKGGSTGV